MARYHISKEHDQFTGITESVWYDDSDGKVHINRRQVVDDIYKANQVQQREMPRGYRSVKSGIYHKARIPMGQIEEWHKKGINWFRLTDGEKRKLLNANPHLHVKRGRM